MVKDLPENCVSMEDYKKRRPKNGVFNFEGFMKRPNEDLTKKVQESMKKNLNRDVSETEARNHIKIVQSFQTERAKSSASTEPTFKQKLLSLDLEAADKGSIKKLRDWNFYWSCIKDGRIMASASDIYHSLKELNLYKNSDDKVKSNLAKKVIKSLYSDLFNNGLLVSTRIEFEQLRKQQSLHAFVINHYSCQYRNETSRERVYVPSTKLNTSIEEFAQKSKGLDFLKTLFLTNDCLEEIIKTFSLAFVISRENIKLFIGNDDNRKKRPHRVIKFVMNKKSLYIAALKLETEGRSRGYLNV